MQIDRYETGTSCAHCQLKVVKIKFVKVKLVKRKLHLEADSGFPIKMHAKCMTAVTR